MLQNLPAQEQRKVSGTEYARSRGAKFLGFTTIGIGETDWWLRSPGKESYDACFLDVRGAVGTKCVTVKLGVRPALWMDLSADRNAFPYDQQVQAKQVAEQGDYAEATALLDTLAARLGDDRAVHFHAHFSRIAYTKGGEKCHLTFADTAFGPPHAPLLALLKERHLAPTIICESAGTQAEDAAALVQGYAAL